MSIKNKKKDPYDLDEDDEHFEKVNCIFNLILILNSPLTSNPVKT